MRSPTATRLAAGGLATNVAGTLAAFALGWPMGGGETAGFGATRAVGLACVVGVGVLWHPLLGGRAALSGMAIVAVSLAAAATVDPRGPGELWPWLAIALAWVAGLAVLARTMRHRGWRSVGLPLLATLAALTAGWLMLGPLVGRVYRGGIVPHSVPSRHLRHDLACESRLPVFPTAPSRRDILSTAPILTTCGKVDKAI